MDRSLTRGVDVDPARRALAMALAIFAGEVGATVVAEGVETVGEIQALRLAGIHRAQGFALGRPQELPITPVAYVPFSLDDLLGTGASSLAPTGAVSVTAHGLLSAVGAIESALALLRQRPEIGDIDARSLIATAERHAHHVGNTLHDLVRGLPAEELRVPSEQDLSL
jgi:hypothetical protein